MKLLITQNEYGCGKNKLEISPDCKKIVATSYGWWKYVYVDSVGNVIYNNSTYSNTTSKHQGETSSTLRKLGINIQLELNHTTSNLNHAENVVEALNSEISWYEENNLELKELTLKKGTRKSKNEERKNQIKSQEFEIKDLINFRDNYLNKKLYPVKNNLLEKWEYPIFDENCEYSKRDKKEYFAAMESYKKYFLKDNGVLNTQDYNTVIKSFTRYDRSLAPDSLDKLIAILGNVKPNLIEILSYSELTGLINMMPEETHVDFKDFKKKALRIFENHDKIMNRYFLDKLHQVLVNKINKKDYSPREPQNLPIPEKIKSIQHKDLTLIRTDRELRAEGKRQGHCIGNYVKECFETGKFALNFKGYTFMLNSNCKLVETKGRYNAQTPETIKNELIGLVE